jgi:hypothetical protein
MTGPTLDALARRLGRLERELRGWRTAGILAVAALFFLGPRRNPGLRQASNSRASLGQNDVGGPFHRNGWTYEEKYDGWRMGTFRDSTPIRPVSRTSASAARPHLRTCQPTNFY